MLNAQMMEQKEYQKKAREERIKLQKDIQKAVIEDEREQERIKLENRKRVLKEKANRDMQISLKLRAKQMEIKEQKTIEDRMLQQLQKEIADEKKQNLEKKRKEMEDCKKVIL